MPDHGELLKAIDRTREWHGFLTLAETLALEDSDNVIFDPFSTLIARGAVIGKNNVFHPNTRIDCRAEAALKIGSGNIFHSNTVIEAATGAISIGDGNLFGEGAVCVKANAPGSAITIGDNGRYCGIVNLFGKTTLGSGSQILGNITAGNCSLAEGRPYSHPVADERGAVLKGSGIAREIHLSRGQVIDGWGVFRSGDALPQSSFHP
jgi:hypothetical protein